MQDGEATYAGEDHNCAGGRRTMSREELYALVWQTPLSRLAKTFGLSDVGLRKICVKHGIPTPPLGYWAKLAHGKPVHQPPLPPSAMGGTSAVHLIVRTGPVMPPSVTAGQDAALARESNHSSIVVPAKRPAKLHPVAAATAKALREAKTDSDGFKHGKAPGGVDATVGPDSIDRALCLIDAFARAAEERGHGIAELGDGAWIVVDAVPFTWRLYEIKGRAPHHPTRDELKAQARHEEDRARWSSPNSSRSHSKVYRSWDHFPSGRLAMTFTDTTRFRWGREGLIGHWHDRKSRRLEGYLDEAMAALATGAVAVKHRLEEEAEKERQRAEELERRRREQARRERAMRRHEFMLKKADDYARFERLVAFAEFMEGEVYQYSDEPVDRLIGELKSLVAVMGEGFRRESLQEEIVRLLLYTGDDPVLDPADE